MDLNQEQAIVWEALTPSQKIAANLYGEILKRGEPLPAGLVDYITNLHETIEEFSMMCVPLRA